MKKILYIFSIALCIGYVLAFCLNVSDLVSAHMDFEVFYPLGVMLFSVALSIVMLIINKFKKIDINLFLIPLLFFMCSVITLVIGCNTACEFCSI